MRASITEAEADGWVVVTRCYANGSCYAEKDIASFSEPDGTCISEEDEGSNVIVKNKETDHMSNHNQNRLNESKSPHAIQANISSLRGPMLLLPRDIPAPYSEGNEPDYELSKGSPASQQDSGERNPSMTRPRTNGNLMTQFQLSQLFPLSQDKVEEWIQNCNCASDIAYIGEGFEAPTTWNDDDFFVEVNQPPEDNEQQNAPQPGAENNPAEQTGRGKNRHLENPE